MFGVAEEGDTTQLVCFSFRPCPEQSIASGGAYVFGSFVTQGGHYSDGPERVYPEPSGVSTPHASAEDPAEAMEIDLECLFEPDPLPSTDAQACPVTGGKLHRSTRAQGASRRSGPFSEWQDFFL